VYTVRSLSQKAELGARRYDGGNPTRFLLGFPLLGLCETNSSLSEVVDGVPLAQESIAEDDERACWRWDVHALEGRDTRSLHFNDVVEGGDGKVVSAKVPGELWETVALIAFDRVCSIERLLGSDFLVAN
jgi:hypothetical protein